MPVTDSSAGFKLMGRMSGFPTTIVKIKFKDTETISKGDLVNVESGTADLGATADTLLLGIALQTKAGTSGVTDLEVVADEDAYYGVYDPNARKIGDFLDITGATGAQGVGTPTNNDLIVIANSAADEWTLVRINPAKHARA